MPASAFSDWICAWSADACGTAMRNVSIAAFSTWKITCAVSVAESCRALIVDSTRAVKRVGLRRVRTWIATGRC